MELSGPEESSISDAEGRISSSSQSQLVLGFAFRVRAERCTDHAQTPLSLTEKVAFVDLRSWLDERVQQSPKVWAAESTLPNPADGWMTKLTASDLVLDTYSRAGRGLTAETRAAVAAGPGGSTQ